MTQLDLFPELLVQFYLVRRIDELFWQYLARGVYTHQLELPL